MTIVIKPKHVRDAERIERGLDEAGIGARCPTCLILKPWHAMSCPHYVRPPMLGPKPDAP